MIAAGLVWLQRLLPQRLLGRCVYRLSRSERAWIKTPLIAWFARRYAIALDEAEQPTLGAYHSFNAFFTRRLRPGARPIDPAPGAIVSPVDGALTEFGRLEADRLLQAKGFEYTLAALLGESGAIFEYGSYATVYLSPSDYHRVHVPLAGTLRRLRYIPGRRFSVNAATASRIQALFCRNERLVCWFDSALGTYALVLIGALNVASFSVESLGEIASGIDRSWSRLDLAMGRGDLLAAFNLGSTVVLLFPPGMVEWSSSLAAEQRLLLGQRIGTRPARA